MEEEKKDFVIRDRRLFSEEGQKETEKTKEKPQEPKPPEKEKAPESQSKESTAQLPEINFQTFIFSLNASALVQLGVIEDPAVGQKEKNLSLAKQTIDMLSMLQEKTAGNLTKDEEEMLRYILYDLRIRYVKEKG